jgi:hypothetical protein
MPEAMVLLAVVDKSIGSFFGLEFNNWLHK